MTAWRFLFFSLAVHLLVWFFLLNRAPVDLAKNENQKVEITVVEKPSPQKIVFAPAVPKARKPDLKLDSLKPKYLGEADQRVEKETRAHNHGAFQQGQRGNKGSKNQMASEESKLRESQPSTEPGMDRPNKRLTELGQTLFNQQASDASDLPDVQEGAITALNTERFVYYSFFSRIEQRVVGLWNQNLRDYESRWSVSDQNKLSGNSWFTRVEFILDPEGHFLSFNTEQSSGVNPIDEAAINAFKQAAFFPNPPTGLIQKDGKVHLHFGFRYDVASMPAWARHSSR